MFVDATLNAATFGKNRVAGARAERSDGDYDAINGELTEFEWNTFPGFTTLQLCKINDLLNYLGQTPEIFTERILFISMFTDISCDKKTQQRWMLGKCRSRQSACEQIWCWSMVINWTRFCENGILQRIDHKEPGTVLRKTCCWNSQKADILSSVQRHHCPEENWKVKEKGKYPYFSADPDTIDTIYRIILSVNQLSVYGAVAAVCEEFEDHQDRTGHPVILVGQSIVLGEIKAEVLLQNEDPSHH